MGRPLLFAVLLLSFASPASAQDLGARVTPGGLDTLTHVALDRIPAVYSIERLDPVLFDCPGDDIVANIPPTDVNLAFRDLDVRTDDGLVVVSAVLDIDVANTIQINNVNACFGSALCDVSANLDRIGITVELAAMTLEDGGIGFEGASVDLALASEDLAIDSVGCAVGDAATWLFDAFEDWALELLTPRLETAVSQQLAATLTTLFADTVQLSLELEGFNLEGRLESLDLSRELGVTLGGDLDVEWRSARINSGPAPETQAPEGTALPADFVGDFQFALTDRLVTEALYEAWSGGLMRRLLADQSLSVDLAGDGAAKLIGLDDGISLDVSFDIEQPPSAQFGRSGDNLAELTLGGLHVTVVATPPEGPISTIEVFADARAAATLAIDPALGGLSLDVTDLSLDSIRIDTAGEDIELSGARLERLITSTVAPMLSGRLRGLPVAPGLQPVMGTFVHVRSVESAGGWQRVGADLVLPNPDDVVPPETSFVMPADLLAEGTAAFEVTGTDDDSPTDLLRYRAWLDGTPLDMGTPSGLRTIRFDVTAGEHTLEVAAVDLNDNRDPTPAAHSFTVDGTPPELVLTEQPEPILTGPSVTAAWMATDSGGDVRTRWVIRELQEDGMAVVVQEAPFMGATGTLSVAADALQSNSLFELEVIAEDAAGNLTSVTRGFATMGGGGCSVSLGRRPAPRWLVVGLLGWALAVRRRRAR
ncbi:MAG: hypothetical protein AB8I08_08760 [Sandaracinaceae bacterium]